MLPNTQIYLISGLGADERTFQFLKLNFINKTTHIRWIAPTKNEKISTYSKRIIDCYNIKDNSVVIGVSFGGIISIEISKQVNLLKTILISSIRNRMDLPLSYKLYGKLGLSKLIPKKGLDRSIFFIERAFGIKTNSDKQLLREILNETDKNFAKWAISQFFKWNEMGENKNVIRIHGNNDKLIPFKNQVEYVIDNGTHFMIVQKAAEISEILNKEMHNSCG